MRKTNYAIKIISILSAFTIMAACSICERTKNEYENGTTVLSTVEFEHTNDLSSIDSVAKAQKETTHVSSIVKTTEKTVTTTVPSSTIQPIETTTFMATPDYIPEQEVIDIYNAINDYREENGFNQLVLDEELCKLAYIRAQEQEKIESHTRPDGRRFSTVAKDYNYQYTGIGENIALGPSTNCEKIVNGWSASPTHNENILWNKWTKTGIALFVFDNGGHAIVQLFAY